MARGAIISMLSVILVLPAMFMVFDKLICKTTAGMPKKKNRGNPNPTTIAEPEKELVKSK